MKITRKDLDGVWTNTLRAVDIPIGTVFDCDLSSDKGDRPFLRAYGVIVGLGNPVHTWNVPDGGMMMVYNYRPLKAEVVVHGPE